MRHRASRPLLDLWHRLVHGALRPLGAVARVSPVRAAVAAAVLLGVGTTTVVAVSSVDDGSPERQTRAGAPEHRSTATTSRGTTRPELGGETATPSDPSKGDAQATTRAAREPGTPLPEKSSAAPGTDLPQPDLPDSGATADLGATKAPRSDAPASSPSGSTSPDRQTRSASPRDTTPPNTWVSQQLPAGANALFTLRASESASFGCSLDGGAFTSCGSTVTFDGLRPGWHTLTVRATDRAGNVDPTPAAVRWHANGGPGASE